MCVCSVIRCVRPCADHFLALRNISPGTTIEQLNAAERVREKREMHLSIIWVPLPFSDTPADSIPIGTVRYAMADWWKNYLPDYIMRPEWCGVCVLWNVFLPIWEWLGTSISHSVQLCAVVRTKSDIISWVFFIPSPSSQSIHFIHSFVSSGRVLFVAL